MKKKYDNLAHKLAIEIFTTFVEPYSEYYNFDGITNRGKKFYLEETQKLINKYGIGK